MQIGFGGNLINFASNNKKVVFFGCGSGLDKFLAHYSVSPVLYLVDNDSFKIGKEKYGLKIFSPKKLLHENKDELVILVTSSFIEQINKQLNTMGFKGGVHFFNVVSCSPSKTKLMADKKNNLKFINARRYLNKNICVEKFFDILNKKEVRYVVLRYFEKLPQIEKGEDIDILVHDDDLTIIDDLLDSNANNQEDIAFDVYSVSGLPGSNYDGVPYYLPILAKKIIDERILYRNNIYVPSPKNFLFSFIYHVIYHKGEKSGLPINSEQTETVMSSKRDYKKKLKSLLQKNNYDVKIDLLSLHQLLKENGWAPGIDTIRKLSAIQQNEWVKSLDVYQKHLGEIIVYIIRDRTIKSGLKEYIINWLEKNNLNIIGVKKLSPKEKVNFTNLVRGGNWKKDSFPVCGGPPNTIIVAFDPHPIPVSEKQKRIQKFVKNGNLFLKEKLREDINSKFLLHEHFNPIHSSDDELEALEYLSLIDEKWRKKILEQIELKRLTTFKGREIISN